MIKLTGLKDVTPTPKRVARDIIREAIVQGLYDLDQFEQLDKATAKERVEVKRFLNEELARIDEHWGYDRIFIG